MKMLHPPVVSHHLLLATVTAGLLLLSDRCMKHLKVCSSCIRKPNREWTWRDCMNSLIYSSIVTIWILSIIYTSPELLVDPMTIGRPFAYYLPTFTIGRFTFHLFTYVENHGLKSYIWLKVFHHLLTIAGCMATCWYQQYNGFCCILHITEIPVTLLCSRGLLIVAGKGATTLFTVTKCMLLLSWFIFRVLTMTYLAYLTYVHIHRVPTFIPKVILLSAITFLIPFNFISFTRLLRNDFINKRPSVT